MIQHTFKSKPHIDPRLKPCPLCGSDMLGRFKNSYSVGWVFSCSNEKCLLHRLKNNIRVTPWEVKSEEEALALINQRKDQ